MLRYLGFPTVRARADFVVCGAQGLLGLKTYILSWGLAILAALFVSLAAGWTAQAQEGAATEDAAPAESEEAIDYATLENPVPYTDTSIKRGRTIYMRYCTECHGPDGKALIDIIADAMDLTAPIRWLNGTAPGEVFRSIKEGAGVAMPPFKMQIRRDDDLWHMVNFVQSLWPADKRPELQEDVEDTDAEEESADETSVDDSGHNGG